jgi:glutathione S-transferase
MSIGPTPLLVSHALCPYVQRCIALMEHKGVAYELRLVDLSDRPGWFLDLSPTGKVPLLVVDGQVLFESAAICEYLDETTPGSLLPDAPIARARHRAWIAQVSEMLAAAWGMLRAAEPRERSAAVESLGARLDALQVAFSLDGGAFFGGAAPGMLDFAVAPLLRQLGAVGRIDPALNLLSSRPELSSWAERLFALPAVKVSVPEDFDARWTAAVGRMIGRAST